MTNVERASKLLGAAVHAIPRTKKSAKSENPDLWTCSEARQGCRSRRGLRGFLGEMGDELSATVPPQSPFSTGSKAQPAGPRCDQRSLFPAPRILIPASGRTRTIPSHVSSVYRSPHNVEPFFTTPTRHGQYGPKCYATAGRIH